MNRFEDGTFKMVLHSVSLRLPVELTERLSEPNNRPSSNLLSGFDGSIHSPADSSSIRSESGTHRPSGPSVALEEEEAAVEGFVYTRPTLGGAAWRP